MNPNKKTAQLHKQMERLECDQNQSKQKDTNKTVYDPYLAYCKQLSQCRMRVWAGGTISENI